MIEIHRHRKDEIYGPESWNFELEHSEFFQMQDQIIALMMGWA